MEFHLTAEEERKEVINEAKEILDVRRCCCKYFFSRGFKNTKRLVIFCYNQLHLQNMQQPMLSLVYQKLRILMEQSLLVGLNRLA